MQREGGQEGSNEWTWNSVGKTGGERKNCQESVLTETAEKDKFQLWNKTTHSMDSGAWGHTVECPQNGGRFNRLKTAFIACKGVRKPWHKTDCLEMLHFSFRNTHTRWSVSAQRGRPTPLRFSKRSGETWVTAVISRTRCWDAQICSLASRADTC